MGLNDNILLAEKVLKFGWLKHTKKLKIPIIVGVKPLLSPTLNFGSFATLPDLNALGLQAAEMLLDFHDNGWPTTGSVIEQPVSVRKIINKTFFDKKKLAIDLKAIEHLDEILEK